MDKARLVAITQATVVLILMSLGSVLMKVALADVGPLSFAWLTTGIGMLFIAFYTFVIRRERIPRGLSKEVWYFIIAIGICNFPIARITRPFALLRLPVTTTTYVGNFIGFVTMAMSIFILKEIPTIFQLIGATIAIIGIRIYFASAVSAYELVGLLLVVVGVVAVAYTNNIARKLAIVTNNEISNNAVSTLAFIIGGSISVLIGLTFDWPPKISGWQSWGIVVYVAVFSMGIGLTVWNHILRTLRSYEASILGASTLIWTTILAVIILGESLTWYQITGMSLMIVGLVLVQVRRGKLDTFFQRFKQALFPHRDDGASKIPSLPAQR